LLIETNLFYKKPIPSFSVVEDKALFFYHVPQKMHGAVFMKMIGKYLDDCDAAIPATSGLGKARL
jgi:hypothetical protein